jgi:hypothetical protein
MYQTKTTVCGYALFLTCRNSEIRWLITRKKPVLFTIVTAGDWN